MLATASIPTAQAATTTAPTPAGPTLTACLLLRSPRALVGFQVLCAWCRACLHAR